MRGARGVKLASEGIETHWILTSCWIVISSKSGSNQLYSRMWTVPLSFTESSSKQKPSLLLYIFEQRMVLDGDVVICDNCRVAGE